MRRRHFVRLFVGGVVAATPFLVNAQETIPTVGVLIDMKPSLGTPLMGETFVGYMKGLGWEDGRHYRALFMWTEGHADRIPGLVNELVAKMVTVIVVFGNTAIDAAQRATTTIPIVCMADDMIKSGLAATMARPGSNTTGVSILASELDVKRLELLNEALPGSKRIGVLADPTTTSTRPQLEKAAHELQLDLVVVSARDSQELDRGLKVLETANIAGVNVLASPILSSRAPFIIERLNQAHLPAMYQWPEDAEKAGALFAYGSRFQVDYRHVAGLVTKILRGTSPQDLPIEQPAEFAFVVNLKTAKAIGLTVPPSLLARADNVIE